ncbi:MAG: PorP/SprF family type IX secretion system membrane protein [Saprospiraceae bacterium]|nr:PorP/SprF family type IX secretion system membrane protein [Saprospiraceae bacterium]
MLKRLSLLCALFIGMAGSIIAQDIHFSQFYMSPLNLNPAMTGVLNCKNRFVANYRNQWAGVLGAGAYNTYSFSYDQKNAVGRDDYFGLGGTLWGDVAGETRYGMLQARVSGSYSKKMFGRRKSASYAVIGADLGVTQRKISQNDLRWPSQITNTGFDPTLPGEVLQDYTRYYPDLALGLLWFSIMDENNYWYAGGAAHHINAPNVSFSGGSAPLYRRFTAHAGGEFLFAPKMALMPFALFMSQGPHKEFNGGASLRFLLGNARSSDQSFEAGLYYRLGVQSKNNNQDVGVHQDAVIFQTRFNSGGASYGFTYDLNISKLSSGKTGNGAFEFSIIYQICGPERRGVYCPRF